MQTEALPGTAYRPTGLYKLPRHSSRTVMSTEKIRAPKSCPQIDAHRRNFAPPASSETTLRTRPNIFTVLSVGYRMAKWEGSATEPTSTFLSEAKRHWNIKS